MKLKSLSNLLSLNSFKGSDSEDGEKPAGGIQRNKKKVVKGRQARRISSARLMWS